MAKHTNSNKGWIFGTVLGAVAGAAYAMWKTPMSGEELRGKLTPGPMSTSGNAPAATSGGFSDKFMSTVERTLAPIVGVELGKTANATPNGSHEVTEPVGASTYSADTSISNSNSLRSRRFEWGSPAPETSDDVQTPSAPEAVAVEPNLPEAAPDVDSAESATASDETTSWGTDTLRSNRFAWGEAAPEAMTVTPSREAAPVEPVVDATPDTEQAGRFSDSNAGIATSTDEGVIDPIAASATASSTGVLHPFPKLGGLEDNA